MRLVASSGARDAAVAEMGMTMRVFMARAVLFQDAVAKSVGINSTDLQCANLLLLHGPATAGELADLVGLTAGGAITTVIDRLERAGLVHRSRDLADRRRVLVTADAERLWQQLTPAYRGVTERWAEYLATLDEAQLAFANELLTRASEVNRDEIERLRRGGPR